MQKVRDADAKKECLEQWWHNRNLVQSFTPLNYRIPGHIVSLEYRRLKVHATTIKRLSSFGSKHTEGLSAEEKKDSAEPIMISIPGPSFR